MYLHYRVIGKHRKYASEVLGIPNVLQSFGVSHISVSSLQIFVVRSRNISVPLRVLEVSLPGIDAGFFARFDLQARRGHRQQPQTDEAISRINANVCIRAPAQTLVDKNKKRNLQ